VEQTAFQSIQEMKEHMAEKAKTSKTADSEEGSSDEYESSNNEDD